jgi:hypothetical protein
MSFDLAASLSSVEIRKEAGYQPSQLGVSASDGLAEYDAAISARIESRAAEVEAVLDDAAGAFSWPFEEEDAVQFWPNLNESTRAARAEKINTLARDAVSRKVLGDLALRAAKRLGNRDYYDEANSLFAQGKDLLGAAKTAVLSAVSGADADSDVSDHTTPVSSSARITSVWF